MKRIFSGIQPTGVLHLGNYLGALKQFVELQENKENECIYCIVDLHALTLPKDPKVLRENVRSVLALYLAVGLDPKKSIIFNQSGVPAHSELAWLLTCQATTGELSKMTQYKDKGRSNESSPVGLFLYPVLMAADILLYDADIVPVGKDQKQHIELTRNLAVRVNNKYKKVFTVPEGRILKGTSNIMSLDDPSKKMSKSDTNEFSYISLLDDEKKIEKAIKRATTDSDGIIKFDEENKKGVSNLLTIMSSLKNEEIKNLEDKYKGKGYGEFKNDLIEVIVNYLKPIKEKYEEIVNSGEVEKILTEGTKKANEIAVEKIKKVKEVFGVDI